MGTMCVYSISLSEPLRLPLPTKTPPFDDHHIHISHTLSANHLFHPLPPSFNQSIISTNQCHNTLLQTHCVLGFDPWTRVVNCKLKLKSTHTQQLLPSPSKQTTNAVCLFSLCLSLSICVFRSVDLNQPLFLPKIPPPTVSGQSSNGAPYMKSNGLASSQRHFRQFNGARR